MMHTEFLPATGAPRQQLVLLHGWGCNREVWRPLLPQLREWADITLVDIPGCAPAAQLGRAPALDETIDAILQQCPPHAVYAGWSLGGELATLVAARYPERVSGLVTLCSNPCFVQREGDGWPGMPTDVFAFFRRDVAKDAAAALRRFDGLQAKGADSPRALMAQLRAARGVEGSSELLAGLDWLHDLDLREDLSQLAMPQRHLLAALDALVPPNVMGTLQALCGEERVQALEGLSHLAPLEAPQRIVAALFDFAHAHDLLAPPTAAAGHARDKEQVAASFSRAAGSYDSVAALQRDVGTRLVGELADNNLAPDVVLDLGSGTGHFRAALQRRFPEASYVGLDIAEGMVRFARAADDGQGAWLVADAESLPLATDSVDLVFSSLAIQWCEQPRHLFAELARILRPGGRCVFTTLGPRTLHELRSAWSSVDSRQHVNSFLPAADLHSAAEGLHNIGLTLQAHDLQMRYERVRDLLDELKGLGAHNVNRARAQGLTSRRALQTMLQAYESFRSDGLLPATYEVLFGHLEKA